MRAQRHQHLRHAEREHRLLAHLRQDDRRLGLGELQHGEVPQHIRVVVGVLDERARLRPPHEALPVEQQPPAGSEGREGLSREVGAEERWDVHPRHVAEHLGQPAVDVVGRPRIADLVHAHVPHVAVVADLERRRP